MNQIRYLLPMLAVVVTIHMVLAILYANGAPYRASGVVINQSRARTNEIGAPDERQHANYVQHILDGKGIPVFKISVPDPDKPGQMMRNPELGETYQSHQPPLYYILAAGYSKLLGKADITYPDGG